MGVSPGTNAHRHKVIFLQGDILPEALPLDEYLEIGPSL